MEEDDHLPDPLIDTGQVKELPVKEGPGDQLPGGAVTQVPWPTVASPVRVPWLLRAWHYLVLFISSRHKVS